MRLDRALALDLGQALRSRPVQVYLVIELVASVVFVARRGEDTASMLLLIYLGLAVVAFLAWWAGRHRLAHPQPDPVAAAGPKTVFALVVALGWGLLGFGLVPQVGFVLLFVGLAGWVWAFIRSHGLDGVRGRLARDPRPLLPIYLLIALPKLLAIGPIYVLGAVVAMPSGIIQQLLLLVGLFGPLEAWSRRPAWAALGAALVFAVLHVPIVMPQNGDDLLAATANAAIFQLSVGFIAVLAYRRHRAAVPIGVAHGLAIG